MKAKEMRTSEETLEEAKGRILNACLGKVMNRSRLIAESRLSSEAFDYVVDDLKASEYLSETIEHVMVKRTTLSKSPRFHIRVLYSITGKGYHHLKNMPSSIFLRTST